MDFSRTDDNLLTVFRLAPRTPLAFYVRATAQCPPPPTRIRPRRWTLWVANGVKLAGNEIRRIDGKVGGLIMAEQHNSSLEAPVGMTSTPALGFEGTRARTPTTRNRPRAPHLVLRKNGIALFYCVFTCLRVINMHAQIVTDGGQNGEPLDGAIDHLRLLLLLDLLVLLCLSLLLLEMLEVLELVDELRPM